MKTAVCEICQEKLATFDRLTHPISGGQFMPLGPGYPPPWPATVDWEHMRCPFCRFRPLVDERRVLTDDGTYYEVHDPEAVVYVPPPEDKVRAKAIELAKARRKQR